MERISARFFQRCSSLSNRWSFSPKTPTSVNENAFVGRTQGSARDERSFEAVGEKGVSFDIINDTIGENEDSRNFRGRALAIERREHIIGLTRRKGLVAKERTRR